MFKMNQNESKWNEMNQIKMNVPSMCIINVWFHFNIA